MRLSVLFITMLLFCCCTHAQENKRFYEESRFIRPATPHVLRMEYAFNDPHKIDDEYWGSMTIVFKDTAAAIRKGTLKLSEDEKIISCDYDYNSAWTVHGGGKLLDGTVQIIKWTKKSVVLKINFATNNKSSSMYQRFNGTHNYKFKAQSSKTKD